MIRTTALLLAIAAATPAAARAGLWDVASFGLAAADEIHGGVYIATDYVFDDHGANTLPPAGGDYTYPVAGAPYFKNAADLVEVRVQPIASAIVFGVRLNTLVDAAVPVAAIGIDDGSAPGLAAPWPFGAGLTAVGVRYVLTIHSGGAVLEDLQTNNITPLTVTVQNNTGPSQRQLENTFTTSVPLAALGLAAAPTSGAWRLHAAAGLWGGGAWVPQSGPAAAFDIAFFADAPTDWQQDGQADLLASGDLSSAAGVVHWDRFPDYDAPIATGRLTRVYPSPISAIVGEGIVDWVQWVYDAMAPTLNFYRGLYLPYQVWVPPAFGALPKPLPVFYHMHGASQTHLDMLGRWEDGTITVAALALSPLGAGELAACKDEAEVDVVEALKDVKAHYPVDENRVFMSGESHGGVCTYELSAHYPDLFAAGLPFIGTAEGTPVVNGNHVGGHRNMGSNVRESLINLLNVPWRKTNSALDPIVNPTWAETDVMTLQQLGLDHEFRLFLDQSHTVVGAWQNALFHQVLDGCANAPPGCDPSLDPGGLVRDPNPARVVYRSIPYQYDLAIGHVYRGAYWVSGMEVASAPVDTSFGEVDATSFALAHKLHAVGPSFGPTPETFAPTGDPITFQGLDRVPSPGASSGVLLANLTNLSAVAFDMSRAGFLPCAQSDSRVEVNTDMATAITLNGLAPGAAVRVDGVPVDDADAEGSATASVPVGSHTITVLPEPSRLLALMVGAALVVGLRGRNRIALAFVLALSLPGIASARTPIPSPTVTGPVTGGVRTGYPFNHTLFDLSQNGYQEEEFFVSGTARDHTGAQPPLPFTTRMVVRRPIDPARFNGTVWIEWLNVTGGADVETEYAYLISELLRGGYAAVIMSCQAVGVAYLKSWDPVRYSSLVHPGDAYAADICSQAGQALRNPAGLDPMGGLAVQRLIIEGESQSANELGTYVNSVAPLIEPVFDGFILTVGAGDSFRADLDVRVLQVLSELEMTSAAGGPPDSAFFRRWEIAGGAHSDRYSFDYVGPSFDYDHGLPRGTSIFNGPDNPGCLHNRAPKMLAQRAALYHMHRWIKEGVLPPIAPRIQFAGAAIARDAHGNALGGLRLPHVDVPVARYSGEAADSCSPLSGKTEFFDAATLASLYPSQQAYEDQLRAATNAAVAAGFILPADAHYWYCGDYTLGGVLQFTPFHDCDADGVADAVDNCPQRANPGNEDDGGIATAVADGIGNACQCGDVTGNGIVNGQDANAIRRYALGAESNPLFAAPENCDVSGNGQCNGQDANAVKREALGIEPNPLFGTYRCESAQGAL